MNFDPKHLTFSQANGLEDLPEPLKLGQIPRVVRLLIWDALYLFGICHVDPQRFDNAGNSTQEDVSRWTHIFINLNTYWLSRPFDDLSVEGDDLIEDYKSAILSELPFNRLFDLLQMIMQHEECPNEFVTRIGGIFRRYGAAYAISDSDPVTIVPARTQIEGKAIVDAIYLLGRNDLTGSAEHLRKSSACISRSDWAGGIRESIHAVESVVNQLTDGSAGSLSSALNLLDGSIELHPALKKAIKSLYGYTSNEQGIRHPLVERDVAAVGMDEAVFMLGACASFCSFLWNKYGRS